MTTGLTYSTYVTQIATMAVVAETNTEFQAILPAMIDYAELRIYRDLDLLSTVMANTSYSLVPNGRTFTFAMGDFVTLQQVNVITPSGTTNADSGTRVALLPSTKEFLDVVYPNAASASIPAYFAPLNQNTFVVGPWPNSTYTLELVGTYRPASLAATNTTTFISTYLPDLFIMASMVYISAYQRNFGRESDDPQMAQSYEAQYKGLLQGATVEEYRKKFEAGGWTSMSPAVVASPTRG